MVRERSGEESRDPRGDVTSESNASSPSDHLRASLKGRGPKLLLLVFVLLYLPLLRTYGWQQIWPFVEVCDLPSFYFAATTTFGDGESVYQPEFLEHAEGHVDQRVFPFLYPPPALLAFYPLSWLSYDAARVAFVAVSHLALLIVGFLLLFRILGFRFGSTLSIVAVAYVLVFHPFRAVVELGQVNMVVLLCLCLAWWGHKQRWHSAAVALPLSLAILIKTYPLLLLLYLLLRRDWKTSLWAGGLYAAYVGLSFVLLPAGVWPDWLSEVAVTGGYGQTPWHSISPAAPWNQSINGFFARMFLDNEFNQAIIHVPHAARALPALAAVFVVGITAAATLFSRLGQDPDTRRHVEWATFLAAMVLVSPLSWEHHLVFVLPSALVALRLVLQRPRSAVPIAVVGVSLFLLACRLPIWSERLQHGGWILLISIKLYAVLLLWGYLVVQSRARTSDGEAE